jgi:hypothetical protein
MQFADEWLVPTVEPLVKEADITSLRDLKVDEPLSLWETLVQRKVLTDEQILSAVARRFHLAIADLSQLDTKVREEVPESLVRKFNILPVKINDSTLEVATANPFDMDAEKMLAFATGREVRMLICAPNRIREKLDELYQKEDVVSKLLEGMAEDVNVTEIRDDEEEFLGGPGRSGRSSAWWTRCWPTASPAAPATFTSSRSRAALWSATALTACCARS